MLDRRQILTRSGVAAIAAAGLSQADAPDIDAAQRAATGQRASQEPPQSDDPLQYAVASDPAARLAAIPVPREVAGRGRQPAPAGSLLCFLQCHRAASRAELIDLLKTLTERARSLPRAASRLRLGPVAPPSDSGTLGPRSPPTG